MSVHIMPRKVYYAVFATLMILTALTVWVAYYDMGPLSIIVALGIASVKATLVMLYFMHLRYSSKLIWVSVGTGLVWLAILILITLSDYTSRAWIPLPGT